MTLTSAILTDAAGNTFDLLPLIDGPITIMAGAHHPSDSPPPWSILEQSHKVYTAPLGSVWVTSKRSPLPTLWEVLTAPPPKPRAKWKGRKIRRRTR